MKIDFIVAYIQRYEFGHEKDFVPPLTGIHMAAITPATHTFRLLHQQLDEINFDSDADLVAVSFFSGFAPSAYRIAAEFRNRGKTIIAGGPHVTFNQKEALEYFNSIVIGEAEAVWQKLLTDFETNQLQAIYYGQSTNLQHIPTPRYDLLSEKFFIKKVIQATRGCPYSCSFCTVPSLNPGFRLRPVSDVIKDASYDNFNHWWQRKIVWFWDDNLTVNRKYIKELLTAMIPLKKWWLTQASIDIVNDEELLVLMKKSGCIGVFLGIESFGKDSLADANKKQNSIGQYKQAVKALHRNGIAVMAGFIAGFDHDNRKSIAEMADKLMEIGIDVPFLSVMTPFKGTAIYEKLKNENRIITSRGWEHYNGYNVAFHPKNLSPEELLPSHRNLWKKSFSPPYAGIRIIRSLFYLRFGSFCLVLFMNAFYCVKRLRGNMPVSMTEQKVKTMNHFQYTSKEFITN